MNFKLYWDGACSIDKILTYAPKGFDGFILGTTILFGKNKTKAIGMMNNIKTHIRDGLYNNLMNDKNVRKDAFNESFTADKFIDIILSFIISAMTREDYDSSGIKEIIKRSIY